MDARSLLIGQLESGAEILTTAAEGLSDEEFDRTLPNAGESAAWLFGHLAANEDWFLSKLTGSPIEVPEPIRALDQADFPPPDHPKGPAARAEVLDLFRSQRDRTLAAVRREDPETWDAPAPEGLPAPFTTTGAAWGALGTHQFWHIGQLMSIRAMLGKPAYQFRPGAAAPAKPAGAAGPTRLVMPADPPRVRPREEAQVRPEVVAEFEKARVTWGIRNNLAMTMGCHPQLALTEVDYANSFIFQEGLYQDVPHPAAPARKCLFPAVGFVDRVTKELVISLVSLLNRSRYSITHHTAIGYGTLCERLGGPEADRPARAEAMLLGLVDSHGRPSYRGRSDDRFGPLYSPLQTAALDLAVEMVRNREHAVPDDRIRALRGLFADDASGRIAAGPLAVQFGGRGPDAAYLEAYIDAMQVELTWCIGHFILLNKFFTINRVRDEEFPFGPAGRLADGPGGQSFVDSYNARVPESIKVRNNALLGPGGWGAR